MRELTSNDKGLIAEAAIQLAAAQLGVVVYMPTSGHSRADMMFEIGDDLYRVQVKWGRLSDARDVVSVHTRSTYLTPAGYVRSPYDATQIDLLAVYCGELDRAFLLPVAMVANSAAIQLRLTPPRNNQRACINLAEQYEFAGAVAQLEERRHGMAEARGSSPLSSTEPPPASGPAVCVQEPPAVTTIGANTFRDELGLWMDHVAAGEEIVVTRRGQPRFRMVPP